jgi:hypothetical protein
MKFCKVCFMLIYHSLFGYCAIAQASEHYKPGDALRFTNFEIENKNGRLNFTWEVTNQLKCRYFEVERSDSADYFKVIAMAFPFENNQDSTYKYFEYTNRYPKTSTKSFYRIKARMENDRVIYSAVVTPVIR